MSTTRIDWCKRDFSCDLWIDPPGQVWVDFVHDTDELVMLTEGENRAAIQWPDPAAGYRRRNPDTR